MTQRRMHGHEASRGMTEYEGAADAERIAQSSHIVGQLFERARCEVRTPGTSLAAQIDVNHLGVIVQRSETVP